MASRSSIGPLVQASREVDAPPAAVFALLADPRRHADFDGSGTVRGRVAGPARLAPGAKFAMSMRLGAPYLIRNTVVEFEADRLIAWRHLALVRWRYELEPLDGGTRTRVTESWDARRSPVWPVLKRLGSDHFAARAIRDTLPRLAALAAPAEAA